MPSGGKNCYNLGHFVRVGSYGLPNYMEMFCPFESSWMISKPVGYDWTWSSHDTGSDSPLHSTFLTPKTTSYNKCVGFEATSCQDRYYENY